MMSARFAHDCGHSSRRYRESRGLPPFHHVLHPRAAGFVAAVQTLGHRLDAVYDVAIRYELPEAMASAADPRPSEIWMAKGAWPIAARIEVARVPAPELPCGGVDAAADSAALTAWLISRWDAKEAGLGPVRLGGEKADLPPPIPTALKRQMFLHLVGWAAATAAAAAAVWSYASVRTFAALAALACVAVGRVGGADTMLRRRWAHGRVGAPETDELLATRSTAEAGAEP